MTSEWPGPLISVRGTPGEGGVDYGRLGADLVAANLELYARPVAVRAGPSTPTVRQGRAQLGRRGPVCQPARHRPGRPGRRCPVPRGAARRPGSRLPGPGVAGGVLAAARRLGEPAARPARPGAERRWRGDRSGAGTR